MLFRTKLFTAQFFLDKADNDTWDIFDKTEDLDKSINNWLSETGYRIVSTSAPAIHAEWLDSNNKKKTVILSVMVIYLQEGGDNAEQFPEFRES